MSVEVIIPYAGEDPDRELALAWVMEQLRVSLHGGDMERCRSTRLVTFMPAVEQSEAEIIVMHDADVWTPGLDRCHQCCHQW